MNINIALLTPNAKMPTYSTAGAAGFDFYATESGVILPGGRVRIGTGVAMEIPEDHALLLFSRSGMGASVGARLANCVGVIDSDYRGEIVAVLTTMEKTIIRAGDRIAQGVIVPIQRASFNLVASVSETERGGGGFGSTGA